MVGADQPFSTRQPDFQSVPKFRFRPESEKSCDRLKPKSPQGQVNLGGGQQLQLLFKKIAAPVSFLRGRPVIRRRALYRSGDPDIFKFQTILSPYADLLACPTRPPKRPIQPTTRLIAREHSACPVGPVGPGRQTNDHDAGFRIAPTWHRLTPIFLRPVSRFFFPGHFFPPPDKAGTTPTGDNPAPEGLEAHRFARGRIWQDVRPIQREMWCRFLATIA